MTNTIILLKGELRFTKSEYKGFSKGNTIWGDNNEPEEMERWSIEEIAEAKAELAKYRCSYTKDGELYNVTEYALEYCECDGDGEFISGSDYDLAAED